MFLYFILTSLLFVNHPVSQHHEATNTRTILPSHTTTSQLSAFGKLAHWLLSCITLGQQKAIVNYMGVGFSVVVDAGHLLQVMLASVNCRNKKREGTREHKQTSHLLDFPINSVLKKYIKYLRILHMEALKDLQYK